MSFLTVRSTSHFRRRFMGSDYSRMLCLKFNKLVVLMRSSRFYSKSLMIRDGKYSFFHEFISSTGLCVSFFSKSSITFSSSCMPDDQLVKQVGRASPLFNDLVAPLSAIFVRFPSNFRYGTRTHTVFVVDQQNNATFFEKRIEQPTEDIENAAWKCEKFTFKLSNKDHVKHEITSNC